MTAAAGILTLLTVIYALGLLRLARGLARLANPNTQHQPVVSIVVAARNESANIVSCLRCLQNQDYPTERLEILVVDDRSEDETSQLVTRAARQDARIHLLQVHDRVPGFAPKKRAIDLAVRSARGEIIMTTDADCRPPRSWVSRMMQHFDDEVGMVAGYNPYSAGEGRNTFFQKLLALDYFAMACVALASARLGYPVSCSGGNLAYRKKMYFEVGGFGRFASHPSGDDDLLLQLVREQTDWKIVYAAATATQVPTTPPATFSEFVRQRLRYASKGRMYSRPVALVLTAVYLMNLGLAMAPVLSLATEGSPWWWLSVYGIKVWAEFLYLNLGTKVLGGRVAVGVFAGTSILHPVYIAVIGLLAQFVQFEWKGRSYVSPATTAKVVQRTRS